MKRRPLFLLGLWLLATAAPAAAPVLDTTTWTVALTNETQNTESSARMVLRQDGTKLTGTLTLAGTAVAVEGKREAAWVELVWTDATGRITQVRAVMSPTDGRGTLISGGGGKLVEYGRVLITVGETAK